MRSVPLRLIPLLAVLAAAPVAAQSGEPNYPGRRALVLNLCPTIELAGFSYSNGYTEGGTRFRQNLTWKNTGSQPVVAFEVAILKYDAFNERLIGSRWTVTGHNSADWSPLPPGESGEDGTISYGSEEVFTAVAYVRTARLADGTIWRANELNVLQRLKALSTGIPDFGDVQPDSIPGRKRTP
ncbi:MAG TPA: hypothetical protein VN674_13845 [Gemmatimonadales bacterium]|nr:hypothetical protein [Gemmatimonadales bacterium]